MIRFSVFSVLCLLLVQPVVQADSELWTSISQGQRSLKADSAQAGQLFRVDSVKLRQLLSRATPEGRSSVLSQIQLPVKNGVIENFSVEESPIMAAGLAAKYPQIKSYKIRGIDHPEASGRISISPKGFHGMITDATGTYYIDPASDNVYRSYSKKSQKASQPFNCGVVGHNHDTPVTHIASRSANRTAGQLRVYRLAVAGTSEYVSAVGGTKDDAMAEINNAINRVNEIYERDLGIRLELIDNNEDLLYITSADLDPYSNLNTSLMLDQNQLNIDNVIGSSNYDIGHVFSTASGGIADVGSVCENNYKAGGVTGLTDPTGDSFYIDYVAHEIGHQFSAEHTFNGTESGCGGGNRWQPTAVEPGSGSTIMSYAGICGSENIVSNADAMFHSGSIIQVDSFTTSPGLGASCGNLVSFSNFNEPTVVVDSGFNIPRKTAFKLTAQGSDNDGDSISYTWDQMDAGTATSAISLGTDLTSNSLFRSYLPRPENYRHFPALGTTLQNKYDDSENLPCQTRSLNFTVMVRDNQSGIAKGQVQLSVDNGSGPFQITSFNQSQTLTNDDYSINWDVANTDVAPVSCSTVDISLLTFNTDSSSYFETLLSAGESNDGTATITLPDNSTTRARFKIQCSDNVFYDISDANLVITGSSDFNTTGKKVFYNSNGLQMNNTATEVCELNSGGTGDENNDNFSSAALIVLDQSYSYGLQFSDDVDFFKIVIPFDGTMTIKTSGITDTLCGLFSDVSMLSLIAYDDDGGSGYNCLISESVAAGTYYISVEGALLETIGNYNVLVNHVAPKKSSGSVDLYWLLALFSLVMIGRKRSIRECNAA